MDVVEDLVERNRTFATGGFAEGLRMMPALRTIVIGCVDPRVDPAEVLGTHAGEVAVLRNVGGRVTPDVLDQLAILRHVTRSAGGDLGAAWEIVVLHHTDCGITRVEEQTDLLAGFLGVVPDDLPGRAVADPRTAVALDVDAVLAEGRLGAGVRVSGLVYDVATGRVELMSRPRRS